MVYEKVEDGHEVSKARPFSHFDSIVERRGGGAAVIAVVIQGLCRAGAAGPLEGRHVGETIQEARVWRRGCRLVVFGADVWSLMVQFCGPRRRPPNANSSL